jgi:anti-sigma factor RsiW
LPWPSRPLIGPGAGAPVAAVTRGFNVLLWRRGDLGYALVSDLDATELRQLADKLAGSG